MSERRPMARALLHLFLAAALLFPSTPPVLAADQPIRLYVDGQEVKTDVPPQIIEGHTMVPVGVVAQHLRFSVEWIAATRTVRLTGPQTVVLRLDSPEALVGGRKVTLEVPAQSVDGRTLVPLRFIAETLGYDVEWDGQERAVRLTTPPVRIMYADAEIAEMVKITIDRNEQDMTEVRGTLAPRLGWKAVTLRLDTGVAFSRRQVPVTDGTFAVSAAVPGGEPVQLYLYSDGADKPFATLTVVHPEGIQPRVLTEHGIEIIDIWTTKAADRLSATPMPGGLLHVEGTLTEPPTRAWLSLITGGARTVDLALEDGRFETVVPLKGPALYRLCINSDSGTPGCMIVEQTQEVSLEPMTLWGDYLRFEDPLASGMTVGDSMRVAGRAQDLSRPQVMLEAKKLGSEEELVWQRTLDVRDGRFDGEIWFPFGAGDYEVTVWRPDESDSSRWWTAARWSVRSTVEKELRYLVPGRRIESDAPEIVALAEEITSGLSTPVEKARAIHDWVARNIAYDVDKFLNNTSEPDEGALKTLATRKGVCRDYVYLTIALLRAAGIKARYAGGQADGYGGWGDHAWTEAWVGDRWLVMDTTWDAGYTDGHSFHWRFQTKYFDPDPEVFALDHRLEEYKD